MNKEALLLYNPYSGHKEILFYLDYITSRVQRMGYHLKIYRSICSGSIEKYIIEQVDCTNTDMIIVSGGDGTLNECINGMMKKQLNIPLAILPLGTSNDFAHSLGISQKIPLALDIISEQHISYIDVGKANDKFFINVCSMGAFSMVSQNMDLNLKNKFGKFAYYIKGVDALSHYRAIDLEVMSREQCLSNKFFLILIFNGKGAGGFMKLAHQANLSDGLFDIICFKDIYFYEIPQLFFKVLQGEHFNHPDVIYFKTSQLSIKHDCYNQFYTSDLDGEHGPSLPLNISVVSKAVPIYTPKTIQCIS